MITAQMLLLQGFNVDLVAHVFPKKMGITNGLKDHMASQIAGGLFLPYGYHQGKLFNNHRAIKDTFNVLTMISDQKL